MTTANTDGRQLLENLCRETGWNVTPDPTINFAEFAAQYQRNPQLWTRLFQHLAHTDLNTLAKGKIDLIPGHLWINVLEYTPKSPADTPVESHREMIDLQYTFVGNELMGLAQTATTTIPYNPEKDVEKYTASGPVSYVPATPDRFFLYFPSDLHQPSVIPPGQPATPSRKIVGKIRYSHE